ncbi:hypothetical protein JCM11641_004147 [Rhodosporidiobolus odoratus]
MNSRDLQKQNRQQLKTIRESDLYIRQVDPINVAQLEAGDNFVRAYMQFMNGPSDKERDSAHSRLQKAVSNYEKAQEAKDTWYRGTREGCLLHALETKVESLSVDILHSKGVRVAKEEASQTAAWLNHIHQQEHIAGFLLDRYAEKHYLAADLEADPDSKSKKSAWEQGALVYQIAGEAKGGPAVTAQLHYLEAIVEYLHDQGEKTPTEVVTLWKRPTSDPLRLLGLLGKPSKQERSMAKLSRRQMVIYGRAGRRAF